MSTQHGTVVAAFGRHYSVELPNGELLECVPRGKKSEVACGDEVEIGRTSVTQGVIEKTLPRRSLLYRSVAHREKLIAANVTQLIVVVASEPSFSDELLARCLVAADGLHSAIRREWGLDPPPGEPQRSVSAPPARARDQHGREQADQHACAARKLRRNLVQLYPWTPPGACRARGAMIVAWQHAVA